MRDTNMFTKTSLKGVVALTTLSMLCALGGTAAAQDFDTIGAGCIPSSAAIQNNHHLTSGGGLSQASGVTTTITAICPIYNQSALSTPTSLSILYTDSTNVSGNKVAVSFKRMAMGTGVVSTVATIDTDASSPAQDNPCAQSSLQLCTETFSHTMDPGNYWYFLEVTIARTSTSNTETLWGVSLY